MDTTLLLSQLQSASTMAELETAYESSLGKKWRLSAQYIKLKDLPPEEKKTFWLELAQIKTTLTEVYEERLAIIKSAQIDAQLADDIVDITTPAPHQHRWSYSLLTATRRRVEEICQNMWFSLLYGHDMVTKFENFTSLNIPLTHPATEMHDTFFLTDKDETGENYVLRTHTTAMDNHVIKQMWVPCKFAIPSKVYRYESTDASHDTTFYQLEGTYIDKGVSIAHFKDFIQKILSAIFEKEVTIRMRPGYFPFVEPGFEIDASCPICGWSWCSLCKKTWWIEIMGAGMLHPEVLRQAGVDPDIYSGYAFGMGINRLVAVKYRIKDIRLFTNGDLRFSRSFG